jgi:hypothetical protein
MIRRYGHPVTLPFSSDALLPFFCTCTGSTRLSPHRRARGRILMLSGLSARSEESAWNTSLCSTADISRRSSPPMLNTTTTTELTWESTRMLRLNGQWNSGRRTQRYLPLNESAACTTGIAGTRPPEDTHLRCPIETCLPGDPLKPSPSTPCYVPSTRFCQ